MQILELRAMRGPNYWSNYRKKLILMRLDIEEFEEKPTNKIPGFRERLEHLMPGLIEHGCSYKKPGGFFLRVEEGTWAGHVIEHIALEMQIMTGMEAGFGRTRGTSQSGIYNIVFSYAEEEAGKFAARASVELFERLARADESADESIETVKEWFNAMLIELKAIAADTKLGPSTAAIVHEAQARGIPAIRLDEYSLVQLGYGIHQKRIQATTTSLTSSIGVDIACDKTATKKMLGDMGLPVPKGYQITDEDEVEDVIAHLGFPLVVKPVSANHGKGITVNVHSLDETLSAFRMAKQHSSAVILEEYFEGSDFRILIINKKFVAAAERFPACVLGDGKRTIAQLVEDENHCQWRGCDHENFLSRIIIDGHTLNLLSKKGYSLDTVLPEGERCCLKATANLSTGGTAIDRTDEVHPDNILLFERAARIIGLDIAGIDVVAKNISEPIEKTGGAIIEVNAAPGFRMHLLPSIGQRRNVAKHVVDMLFPEGSKSRIPIFAITGTNGKTTTTRLIAHVFQSIGKYTGLATSDGIYMNGKIIQRGDNTGPISAGIVLKDPALEVAVLETARGGILRSGLAFDHCDVGIVTNVTADHLGLNDIHTLDEMARVKSVVARSVKPDGYVILNADDDRVYEMRNDVDAKVCLFSTNLHNPRIQSHVASDGIAAVWHNDSIYILKGKLVVFVEKVENIPITYSGRAAFMVQNSLAAILACFVMGVRLPEIRHALHSFVPSVTQTPGRLNLIELEHFSVLVDYAHNPSGFMALRDFLKNFKNPAITGVFGGTGDRRDEDIIELGRLAATMFDKIVIKDEACERRGRKPGEISSLLYSGVREVDEHLPVKIIACEQEAINHALGTAVTDELVVVLADDLPNVFSIIASRKERIKGVTVKT